MAYEDFKDLARRTTSDKVLRDKAFNITKNPEYEGYERGLASMFYKDFDKRTFGSLADMQLTSKCNKGIRFFLCVIDIFSEYAWVFLLKNKKV